MDFDGSMRIDFGGCAATGRLGHREATEQAPKPATGRAEAAAVYSKQRVREKLQTLARLAHRSEEKGQLVVAAVATLPFRSQGCEFGGICFSDRIQSNRTAASKRLPKKKHCTLQNCF